MAIVSLFLLKAALPLAVSLVIQAPGDPKSSCRIISPMPGLSSGVGGGGVPVGNGFKVGVGGNHTVVGVLVAVSEGTGEGEGNEVGVDVMGVQAESRNEATRIRMIHLVKFTPDISGSQAWHKNLDCVVKLIHLSRENINTIIPF